MTVALREQPFDPWREIVAHQDARLTPGTFGATASFVGTMRDFNDGVAVEEMFLEHYPGMTERELDRIVSECATDPDIVDVLVIHRVGSIAPGEPIVLVAVWSAHRAAAFDASRCIMEALKSRAPLWKRERGGAGERWVKHNAPKQ